MSEPQPAQTTPTVEYETRKVPIVRFIGRMNSVSHRGSDGRDYFFAKDRWVEILPEDEKIYKRKAVRNPQNWAFSYKDVIVYDEVHKVKFKGNKVHHDQITLVFEKDEKGDPSIQYIFKVDKWTIVEEDWVAKILSDKALFSPNTWAYELDKVARVKKATQGVV